jgi:hypothetical protein
MLNDGKNITALKDDKSISTLSTRDCSHDGVPLAAFNDGWTTFEEWNYNKRPSTRFQMIPATATSSQRAPRELPELPSITMTTISGALIIQ